MTDISFRKKTLQELSIDKEASKRGDKVYVTNATIEAIDFDDFAKQRCARWNVSKLRSCDALLADQPHKYLIEFKNRPLRDNDRSKLSPEREEERLKEVEGRREFDEQFQIQHGLELELLEKLYDSLIIIDGVANIPNNRIIENHNDVVAIVAVSSRKNNDVRIYNDRQHPDLYATVFSQGDPVLDNIVMDNLNRPMDANDSMRTPKRNIDIYDDWFCPRYLKRLEGTLYKKVLFMTGTQLTQFLHSRGYE